MNLAVIITAFIIMLPSGGGDATVRDAVLEALRADGHETSGVEVEVLRVTGVDAATGRIRVELSGASLPRARTQVRVLSESSDGTTTTGWALLNVLHYDSVAVVTTDVNTGDPVSPSDVSFEWTDVTTFRGTPLRASERASLENGGVWARALRDGRLVRTDDLRRPFAAETGDTVIVEYTRGTLVLRLSGRAREPGAVGDVIRIYSPETRATYRARLTGEGIATWIETRS